MMKWAIANIVVSHVTKVQVDQSSLLLISFDVDAAVHLLLTPQQSPSLSNPQHLPRAL